MVQLSLIEEQPGITLASRVGALRVRAARWVGDSRHADEAAHVTLRRFAGFAGGALAPAEIRRVEAYYSAVLRRRILTSRDESSVGARQRLVAASIEADLISAGWSSRRARAEASRVLGETASRLARGVA